MCRDLVCHWQFCDHRQRLYGLYGHHMYNEPRYLGRPGIPYEQSRYCREQTQHQRLRGWCPPCGYGHLTRQGWNFRGHAGRRPRYYWRIVRGECGRNGGYYICKSKRDADSLPLMQSLKGRMISSFVLVSCPLPSSSPTSSTPRPLILSTPLSEPRILKSSPTQHT
jgi:hypothetical protein